MNKKDVKEITSIKLDAEGLRMKLDEENLDWNDIALGVTNIADRLGKMIGEAPELES